MSFREKSAWGCLAAILLIYVPYFSSVIENPAVSLFRFWISVVLIASLLIGYHILAAATDREVRANEDEPPFDELDRAIDLKASKIAGTFLGFFVLTWVIVALVNFPLLVGQANEVLAEEAFVISGTTALYAINALFGVFVLANVVFYGVVIAGYRRIARG